MMNLISDSRDVSIEEGVAMGLWILCHGIRQRIVAERYQHSTGIVHYWFKKVVRSLASLGTHLIKRTDKGLVQPEIQNNPRWYPYFKVSKLNQLNISFSYLIKCNSNL